MSKHQARTQIVDGGMNTRRVALVVLLALAVLAAVAPVLVLQRAAANRAGDPAYRALVTYALAHNGDHSLDAKAAEALPTLQQVDLGDGRTQLSRLSPEGTCWVVLIEDDRAQAPRKGVLQDCSPAPAQ